MKQHRDITILPVQNRLRQAVRRMVRWGRRPVYWGRHMASLPAEALVFFPVRPTLAVCGLAGIVAFKGRRPGAAPAGTVQLETLLATCAAHGLAACLAAGGDLRGTHLGGDDHIRALKQTTDRLKEKEAFFELFRNPANRRQLRELEDRLRAVITEERRVLAEHQGHLQAADVESIAGHLETLEDVAWGIGRELLANMEKIEALMDPARHPVTPETVEIFYNINAVLNSIDHLEVRGRDSAGLSLMFMLDEPVFQSFEAALDQDTTAGLGDRMRRRARQPVLGNQGMDIYTTTGPEGRTYVTVSMVYKVAAEIGSLGDNIRFIRNEIRNDPILQTLVGFERRHHTVSSHTRWASVGAINEANCHPLDARTLSDPQGLQGPMHVCLNGDIDNFMALKTAFETGGDQIQAEISTDTKIIPLQVSRYLNQGHAPVEAFRRAVNDFEGSHAISMHTALAPGKLFLAQKGSGQAIFVGLARDHYMPTSEVYGFIEQTQQYLKMDGEKIVDGRNGRTQGQIFILDQNAAGGLDGIQAMYYDGTPIALQPEDIKQTALTSRDINRQDFPHYFLKEISEAPDSVAKTLYNRWKIKDARQNLWAIDLDATVVPPDLRQDLGSGRIRRIYFVGQGTAGVAALACANLLSYYLDDPSLQISALKASELSGFMLDAGDAGRRMADALVVAISQSGTTTDTNRTVDMVRERGARTLAIVNRRDSDLTFKVDGVLYTSSGRDIEMSVASTKAFYSQIVAGALLSLLIAALKGRRDDVFITQELRQLLALPEKMQRVIAMRDAIAASARRLAVTKTYWAAVGSGPNKASADEIRIKLSELCYKTISSDFVEDKKHIDLSSEPLIIVCAAGCRNTVIGDIVKDTAIFKAHKATPVVIADEDEDRFAPYAEDVFHVPRISEHLAPVLNTLVGHLWGYYAALAINEGSRFLFDFQETIQQTLEDSAQQGLDIYELILEKSFRQKFAAFYQSFRQRKLDRRLPAALGLETASDLTLLFKYLAGKLPVSDFEIDFGHRGTARNMLDTFFAVMARGINAMSRPIDAIKHQAKTVTVGTSRIRERLEGLLFKTLTDFGLKPSQLTNRNVLVLKNLQEIVATIHGGILYRIAQLDLLGEITEDTTITILQKTGVLATIPSRVETDNRLKGTKKIIVRQGNVYIGKGRKDDRSILIIPVISDQPNRSNVIEYLLLLNIGFREDVTLADRIRALGGKYDHIRSIVQENNVVWKDNFLDMIEMDELFGRSAEKIGERIVSRAA
jgi:glucosamine--fructose-6-phosphate aminotransferase (isomerizing)